MDNPFQEDLELIPDEHWWLFFRFLGMPEGQIKKYQMCCLAEETKYQALEKSFETDKRSFTNKFARFLPRTLDIRNNQRAFNDRLATDDFVPDEIDSADYYEMIARIGKNWLRFSRTELKLKDKDVVRYGDFDLTMEIKMQMSLAWIEDEGRSQDVFVAKIHQFLRRNNAGHDGALHPNLH